MARCPHCGFDRDLLLRELIRLRDETRTIRLSLVSALDPSPFSGISRRCSFPKNVRLKKLIVLPEMLRISLERLFIVILVNRVSYEKLRDG